MQASRRTAAVRCRKTIAVFAWILGLSVIRSGGEQRRVFFWPDSVSDAIHSQVDGVAALETVRELGRFHRVHGSPGYSAAAAHLRSRLAAAGFDEARVEKFPADGVTRYAHFLSYYGWEPGTAHLEEVRPRARILTSFPELPVALADYSQSADVTAELVDVGPGTNPAHYQDKEVAGKIVLASGPLPLVHRRACEERGAVGFLSDFPNQTTAWSGDDRDLVRWGHLSPYQRRNRFAFMLSRRQSGEFRERLAKGEKIVLRANVQAKIVPSNYEVVVAAITGTDRGEEEIVLTAHLCHQSAGANDNASGSSAIFEVARALQSAIRKGLLPKPRRTIRFLWLPEIAGAQAYMIRHPEAARRMAAGIHMDMVGGLVSTIRGTFHLSHSAETLPHIINAIADTWYQHLVDASRRYAESGGNPYDGFAWPSGSREMFLGDIRKIEMGSDHQVFQESSFAVPMVYFHDWPDVTIHTHKDQPENLDATKLGRVAYLGAGIAWTLAALPEAEAAGLVPLARLQAERRLAQAEFGVAVAQDGGTRDPELRRREAIEVSVEEMRSIARLWPSTARAVEDEIGKLRARPQPEVPAGTDPRIPVRDPAIRGPLDLYYYSHISAVLEDADLQDRLSSRSRGEVLTYEALNLVDGKRSVSDIRDILTGRYEPVPIDEVAEYLELLARARVIQWK